MPNVFSVPIFFIVFRETLEAAIIISTLLGIVEQIAHARLASDSLSTTVPEKEKHPEGEGHETPAALPSNGSDASSDDDVVQKKLLRKMRIQVYRIPRV